MTEEGGCVVNMTSKKVAVLSIVFFCISSCLRCVNLQVVSNALAVEFIRGTGQLAILGCILAFILKVGNSRPLVVLSYLIVALMIASHEVAARTKYSYEGQFHHIFASIAFSIFWAGFVPLVLIVKPEPM